MKGKLYIAVFAVLTLARQSQAQAQVQGANCAQTGAGRFPNPNDITCRNYTLCVALNNVAGQYLSYNYVCPTTSLFNPATSRCTTDYVCNAVLFPNPNTACTAEGFIVNQNSLDCSSYIQCVLINGVFTQFPLTCPEGSFYNPATTFCDPNYICPFTCTATGRFPNPADPTCRNYYLCVQGTNGILTEYAFTCPATSLFNPNTGICTTAYTCPQ